jgi:hypothetical protein
MVVALGKKCYIEKRRIRPDQYGSRYGLNKSRTRNEDVIMDTDGLSELAYESIIIANEITDFLKTDLGVRNKDYKDEDSYLSGILIFVRKI